MNPCVLNGLNHFQTICDTLYEVWSYITLSTGSVVLDQIDVDWRPGVSPAPYMEELRTTKIIENAFVHSITWAHSPPLSSRSIQKGTSKTLPNLHVPTGMDIITRRWLWETHGLIKSWKQHSSPYSPRANLSLPNTVEIGYSGFSGDRSYYTVM